MRLDHLLSKRKVIVYVYTQWSFYSSNSFFPFSAKQKRNEFFEMIKEGKTTDESLEVKEFYLKRVVKAKLE